MKNQQSNLKENGQQTLDYRRQQQLEREEIREAIQRQKHEEMLAIKNQREVNEKKKNDLKEQMRQENVARSQDIKTQHVQGSMKKKRIF